MKAIPRLRHPLTLLLLLAVSVGSACTKSLPRSRFVAVYDAEHENGTETLQLHSDGTYLHRFKATDGTESISSGNWDLLSDRGKQRLIVHNFTPHFQGRPPTPLDWTLEPYEDYGLMRLYVSHQPRQFYLELPRK